MNTTRPAFRMACLLVATLVWSAAAPLRGDVGTSTPVVRLEAVVGDHAVRLEAKAARPFEYTTYRPTENLFVLDLAGVTAAADSGARVLKSDMVSSYRVLQYRAGERAIVRIEVLMRTPVTPRVERTAPNELAVVFEGAAAVSPKPESRPAPAEASAGPEAAGRKAEPQAVASSTAKAARMIEQVRVAQTAEQIRVRVEGDGRPAYQEHRLSNPDRVVLDFTGAKLRVADKILAGSWEPVRSVRAGQFKPDVARVVIDLAKTASYRIETDDRGLTVVFEAVAAAKAEPAKAVEEKAEAARTKPPAPVQPETPVPQTLPVIAGAEARMSLPESLTQPAKALARRSEAEAGTTAADTPKPIAQSASGGQAGAASAQQAQQYSGEPISVDFKDLDLKDFFRLVHEISGLNVIVDPEVKGAVTLTMDEVPWDQVLDIVLRNNNLDKEIQGNVLRIARRETLKREAETQRDLIKVQAEAVDPVTFTHVLNYSKATSVRDTLKRFLSPRGEILADERSNMLIIRDIPSVLPALKDLIAQLDRKSQQVEIEVRVVAASRNFSREIGTQFGFSTTTSGTDLRNVFGGLLGGNFASPVQRGAGLPTPPLVSTGGTSIPLNVNLPVGAPNSGITYAFTQPNLAIDFILSAAESRGAVKIISKPKVATQNNTKATIKQGSKIPVQTVVNNTLSVQFIDALLKLEVTPQITAEGTIFMEVVVENSRPDFSRAVERIPAIDTQSAETKVLVGDGGTIVIGGVMVTSDSTQISQVPLLGSIPLIGHLFKRTSVSTESQELLFFLTPRIIPS